MHQSAFRKAQLFRTRMLAPFESTALSVLDIGSAVVAGGHASNREAFANEHWRYVGLDIEAGPNVDLVVAEPYDWREVADASFDLVTCSQVFEHTEFFWITILEIGRVLKPGGLAFIVAPGSGPLHRYPVDCWRFYDDGMPALAKWSDLDVLDARVQWRPVYGKGDMWRDAAIVLQRPLRDEAREARARAKVVLLKSAHLVQPFDLSRSTAPLVESPLAICSPMPMMQQEEDRLLAAKSELAHKASQVGRSLRAIRKMLSQPASDIRQD
ncbi:MAG: class I SAM-dependent methyltransferase [Hyphomicrobiales bacterium]|jgi:SAM-dependent methyltransferase|nr:class I SAM-dependent methyltransferase [Hyphomicrobiales bacterium]